MKKRAVFNGILIQMNLFKSVIGPSGNSIQSCLYLLTLLYFTSILILSSLTFINFPRDCLPARFPTSTIMYRLQIRRLQIIMFFTVQFLHLLFTSLPLSRNALLGTNELFQYEHYLHQFCLCSARIIPCSFL